jgi:hypothetical protein
MVFNEAKYREVSDLVKTIRLDDTDFELFNIRYNLLFCSSKDKGGRKNGEAAEYIGRSNSDYDIYLWEDIGEKIQRPLLFHEIVETYHITQGSDKKHEKLEEMITRAHNATLPLEKRFCEDYLTSSEFEKYLKFKKDHGQKEFELSCGPES